MKNNLCCLVNPTMKCLGCGKKWCGEHDRAAHWATNGTHAELGINLKKAITIFRCPVAKTVRLKWNGEEHVASTFVPTKMKYDKK